eukprot:403363056
METAIQNYLSQTGISQLLGEAFTELTLQKPSDPLIFLSNFLQQRSHLYNVNGTKSFNMLGTNFMQVEDNLIVEQKEVVLQLNHFESNDRSNSTAIKTEETKDLSIDYMKLFNKIGQTTFTLKTQSNGSVVLNRKEIVSNLNQIQEINEVEENSDDDYNVPTEMPQVLLQENEHIMIGRCTINQNVLKFQQSVVTNQQISSENELTDYLKKNSKKYQNVISISEIARGGESVVYKLDYVGIDEVVIKQSVTNTNEKIDEVIKQSVLSNQISETQQLKLLQSDKFIAEVKEEIIEYDFDNNIIKSYMVVVERARFSLNDLLKIWNDEELSDKFQEYYSPEKLAYYFYQTIQIMAYLHQRDVYYGDMKPHNLLVFKDQLVKIGDLGTIIKLDSSKQDDQKAYLIQGISPAYQENKTLDEWRRKIPQSKNELFEIDKYSLIRTFYQCIEKTKQIKCQSENINICQQMLDDLVQKQSLKHILQKYSKIMSDSPSFIPNLIDQMKSENKIESLMHISFLSRYKIILKSNKNGEISQYFKEYGEVPKKDYIQKEFVNLHQIHLVLVAEYHCLTLSTFELIVILDIIKEIGSEIDVELLEQLRKPVTIGTLQQIGEIPQNWKFKLKQKLAQFKLKSSQDARNMLIAEEIRNLVNKEKFQEAQTLCEKFAIKDLFLKKEFFQDNYVDLAIEYFKLLLILQKYEEAIVQAEGWLQKYRDLCGDSHEITLKFYGILGELLLYRNSDDQEKIQGVNYLTKYSKINFKTYIHFLLILEKQNMAETIINYLPPYFAVRQFDRGMLSGMCKSVFLGQFEKKSVIDTLIFIDQEMNPKEAFGQKPENEKGGVDRTQEKYDLLVEFSRSESMFELIMRYLNSIDVVEDEIIFTHQKEYIKTNYEDIDNDDKTKVLMKTINIVIEKIQKYLPLK